MDYEKEIARLQKIEEEQSKILEKQGWKPNVAKVNDQGEVIVDLSDKKQRKLWQE